MEEKLDSYKIVMIGNRLMSLGFKLGGIASSYEAYDQATAEAALKSVLDDKETGIVIITSGVKKLVKDRKLQEAISSSILPLFVEIPEEKEPVEEEDTLRILIMRAIGIDITKNA